MAETAVLAKVSALFGLFGVMAGAYPLARGVKYQLLAWRIKRLSARPGLDLLIQDLEARRGRLEQSKTPLVVGLKLSAFACMAVAAILVAVAALKT